MIVIDSIQEFNNCFDNDFDLYMRKMEFFRENINDVLTLQEVKRFLSQFEYIHFEVDPLEILEELEEELTEVKKFYKDESNV
jgi:exonuclease III